MNYQQIEPTAALRKYIQYFWVLEDNSSCFSCKTFKIMSDGLPDLIYQTNENAFLDKDGTELPKLFLYGQTTTHTKHKAIKNFQNIGIYFQPSAIKSIFDVDAYEFADRNVSLDDLIKTNLYEQLASAKTSAEKIELLSSSLIRLIAKRKSVGNSKVDFATAQIQTGVKLSEVQYELNLSERSLERHFKQHIGITPSLYARINRFQSALDKMRQMKVARLTDLAYQCNYFDQSHFVRDFRKFAGTSPKRFLLQANEQVANFPEWKI